MHIQLIMSLAVHATAHSSSILTFDVFTQWEHLALLENIQQRYLEQQFKLDYKLSFHENDPSHFIRSRIDMMGADLQKIWKLLDKLLDGSLDDDKEKITANFVRAR